MKPRFSSLALALALLLAAEARPGSIVPMEGGDYSRSNRALQPSSVRGALLSDWRMPIGSWGQPLGHPIMLSDRLVQASSASLNAMDRNNGSRLWTLYMQLYNPPSYDAGSNILWTLNTAGRIHAVDPSNGSILWSYMETGVTGHTSHGAPLVAQGKVVFGVPGKGLTCIDAATHAVLWRYNFPSAQSACTPALENGLIYVAGTNGFLACIRLDTGAQQWAIYTGQTFSSAVTLGDNNLFVMAHSGKVSAYSKASGAAAWSYTTLSFSDSNMALCGRYLIVTSDDRRVRAINQDTGNVAWTTVVAGNFARCAPIVVCGVIYVSGCAYQFYGLDGATGAVIWMYTNAIANSFVDWAESDGKLYVADNQGYMNRFSPRQPGNPADCRCELGENSTPTPTSIPTPNPGPCALDKDPGLRLWLKATAGVQADASGNVNVWQDQSGLGHDALGYLSARPQYVASGKNGQPSVHFSAAYTGMNIDKSEAGALIQDKNNFTVVIKAWVDGTGPGTQEILSNWNNFGNALYFGRSGGGFQFGDCGPVGGVQDLTQVHVTCYRSSPQGIGIWVDGALVYSGPALSCSLDTSRSWYLGRLGSYEFGNYFKGDLQELLVFNEALDPARRQWVENCLLGLPLPTRTPTPTPSSTASPSMTASPSASPSSTPTSTPSSTPSNTPIASATATPSSSPSSSPTPTATLSATSSSSPTATPSPSASASSTPTSTATATHTPGTPPTKEPTPEPTPGHCPAQIERLMITPNPQQAAADRMVSVKLGCPAEKVEVWIYSQAGALLFSWVETNIHVQRGQWVHLKYPHEVQLPNGTYFVHVTVTTGETKDHATTTFVVLN